MLWRRLTSLSLCSTAVLISAVAAPGQSDAGLLRRMLVDKAGFTAADLERLDNREIVAKPLKTGDKQEIATVGAVRIRELPPVSMEDLREALSQKKNKAVEANGRFSVPPTVTDLAELKLEERDIRKLRECETGDCDINSPAAWIERFRNVPAVDASGGESPVEKIFREMLLEFTVKYSTEGIAALGNYDNRGEAMKLPAVHRGLVERMLFVTEFGPEFTAYLLDFPNSSLAGVDSDLHWAMVNFGLNSTTTLSHTAAYSNPQGSHFFAARQFYSSRYLDASLSITMLLRFNGDPDAYLLFADRSRSDALDGMFHGIARGVVEKETTDRVKDMLEKAELRLLAKAKGFSGDQSPAVEYEQGGWRDTLVKPLLLAAVLAAVGLAAFLLFRRRLT